MEGDMNSSVMMSDRQAMAIAAMVEGAMYTDEEREYYAKVIAEFNKMYHGLYKQTWCATVWKGINILKPPTDMWIYQEIIDRLKPDLIIETGTMRGGGAVFLDDMCKLMNPKGHVITIDTCPENIDKRAYDSNVKFITGSSVSAEVLSEVKACIWAWNCKTIMVILDSDHSEEHVTNELNTYGSIVTKGSALIVEDTGNCASAMAAVDKWLPEHPEYTTDIGCEKFMLTFHRGGYLEKVGD
jgi:cephalosporin hydroxylase